MFIKNHLLNSIRRLSISCPENFIILFYNPIENDKYKILGLRRSGLPIIKDSRIGIYVGVDWKMIKGQNLINIFNILKEKKIKYIKDYDN